MIKSSITKLVLLFLILVFSSGCASLTGMGGGDGQPVNYGDGSWSKCLYEKDDMKFWLPIQNAPPIGTEQANGLVVKCEPIPKQETSAEPAPATKTQFHDQTFQLVRAHVPKLE